MTVQPQPHLPAFSQADFTASFQGHMPTGKIWPRSPDAVQTQVASALMPTYVRSRQVLDAVIQDGFPATSEFTLSNWEAALGLPDPCDGEDPTIPQRQAHVVARFTQSDGPSIPSLTGFAAALGYPITIVEYAPARAGLLAAGQPVNGPDWAFAWKALRPSTAVFSFAAGANAAGDPLATWGSPVLACELTRLAPAHTVPIIAYAAGVTPPVGT